MTEKRFTLMSVVNFDYGINDNDKPIGSLSNICDLLNELHEENEQLKFQLQNTSDQRDEFHRGARENANRIGKLEKENEQLKKAIVETEKMVQSTYDELTKLRCFKKNILRIKHSWDYLMEAIQYD